MSWWIILLIVIAVLVVYSIISEKIDQRKKSIKHEQYIAGSNAWQVKRTEKSENPVPLDNGSEQLAQRIKKLLYDSAYYQNRNVYEFDNVLKELAVINKDILKNGGKEQLNLIVDRVEYLCGKEKPAFAELINIMRDSYLPEAKSNDFPTQQSNSGYFEKDNHGTRQDTLGKADAYWYNRNFGTGKSEPFLLYAFKLEGEAKKALAEVDFIHVAADTGNLICTRICHFGFYANNTGHWEAIIAGSDFSLSDFTAIREVFKSNNGFVMNERAPEETAHSIKPAENNNTADLAKVVFKRKYYEPVPPELGKPQLTCFTYELYEAPNRATAIKFLEKSVVDKPLYYLLVETPQGNFGKDNGGIYDA